MSRVSSPDAELLSGHHVGGSAVRLERMRGQLVQLRRHRSEQVERLGEAHVDLRLRQRLGRRRHERWTHLGVDLRVALREDGELPLLVAARRGQHVVRQLGRLGHGRVDHDQQIELLARFPPALRVRVREERVRALDDDGADALGVVDQDLLGNQRRREHADVPQRADRGDARRERALGLPDEIRVDDGRRQHLQEDVSAAIADVAGQQMEHADQTRDEGRERRLLDAEVEEDRRRLGVREAARRRLDLLDVEAAATRHLGDVHRRRTPARTASKPVVCSRDERSSIRFSRTITAASASSR